MSMISTTAYACARALSAEQEQFFRLNGFLVLKNLLCAPELEALRSDVGAMIERGLKAPSPLPDYVFGKGHLSGRPVLRRVEYPIAKSAACRALLGHPFILRSVERLQGPSFIPTWDALVIKMPQEGMVVPWHQDAFVDRTGEEPVFNVDFYLDEADLDTAVWAIPGSQHWDAPRLRTVLERRERFPQAGAIPVPMQAGDVLLHDIKLLHGSPPNAGPKLRRVLYYEFRPAAVEAAKGPHSTEYIPLKQHMLKACLEERKLAAYLPSDEESFEYRPDPPYDRFASERPVGFRYEHKEYWKK